MNAYVCRKCFPKVPLEILQLCFVCVCGGGVYCKRHCSPITLVNKFKQEQFRRHHKNKKMFNVALAEIFFQNKFVCLIFFRFILLYSCVFNLKISYIHHKRESVSSAFSKQKKKDSNYYNFC